MKDEAFVIMCFSIGDENIQSELNNMLYNENLCYVGALPNNSSAVHFSCCRLCVPLL